MIDLSLKNIQFFDIQSINRTHILFHTFNRNEQHNNNRGKQREKEQRYKANALLKHNVKKENWKNVKRFL